MPSLTLRALALLLVALPALADDDGWIDLTGPKPFDAWKGPAAAWAEVASVRIDPKNEQRLAGEPGSGVIYNGPLGRAPNLVTKESFGDVELHAEFLVPKGSNSGIKLEGVYEIQIFDSFGVKTPKGSDNGGIYPRAELLPKYHHIDDGYPPLVNASKAPGDWQTLDLIFRAPKFDASGKKVADATFEKVVLNGQVIHKGVSLPYPTGNNWHNKETPTGPILLQADHGPVAFRNVRVRPLKDVAQGPK